MKEKYGIIFGAVVLILILLFITYFQFIKTKEEVISVYGQKQKTLAHQSSLSLENFIEERIRAIEVLTDFPASRKLEQHIFISEYERTYKIVTGFEYIVYINSSGKASAGYPVNYPCPSKHGLEMRTKFLKAFNMARSHRHTEILSKNILVEGKLLLCLISPIFSFENKFQGAILGILNVKDCINTALQPVLSDSGDHAWVLNDEGLLVYHPTHEEMLLNTIFKSNSKCDKCHGDFSLEKQIVENESGFVVKENLNSQKQLVGYSQLPLRNINWIVVVSSPFDQITESINQLSQNFLIITVLMISTILFSASYINRINRKRISSQKELQFLAERAYIIKEKNEVESRYRVLVEQSPDPILLSTREKLIMMNPSFEKLFGIKTGDITNNSLAVEELLADFIIDNAKEKILKFALYGHKSTIIQMRVKNFEGKELEIETSVHRFLLNNRIVYQCILHDVTIIRKLERNRRRQEHLAMIGEMSARISHEIKNPLAGIQTGIQLLEKRISKADIKSSYFQRLRREVQRVDRIVKGLLTFARDDQLNQKIIDIKPLLQRFVTAIQPSLKKENLTLILKMEPKLPKVYIDEHKFEQVLWNIVLNASQASLANSTIIMEVNQRGQKLKIAITDHGEGIPNDILPKVFLPFFSTRTKGSGLGLAISKKIIDMHGGSLKIESTAGRGSTVIIIFPGEWSEV